MFKAWVLVLFYSICNINEQVMFMITYGLHELQRDCLERFIIFKVSENKWDLS